MDRQKLLTNVWKPIFVVFSLTSRTYGYSGYILQNGGITPPIIHQTKMTRFQALYGYAPPRWKELVQSDAKIATVKSQLEENQRVMQVLNDNLTMAQTRMKQK